MSSAQSLTSGSIAARRDTALRGSVGLPAATILLALWYVNGAAGWRQASLFFVGSCAGVILYHSAFGFTSSWRAFIEERRGAGLRAQMLMLAVTSIVFFPLLAGGSFFGQALRGSVSPVGLSVVVGAFLFGVGMQLGGGCASGTLFSLGGGNTRMLVTLATFIAGSLVGTAHMPWWSQTPALPPTSLVTALGPWFGLAVSLGAFAAIAQLTRVLESQRHRQLADVRPAAVSWLRGPWPLVAGAIGLAAVNIATLTISGRPWSVTGAFALWGAKIYAGLGGNVASWPYWSTAVQGAALKASVLSDSGSVMDFGIILGAMLAARLAGRFSPTWAISGQSFAAAVIGGLLLGYGARIAYGCNIGAYFSGIASGSLHGWLWMVAAFAGNIFGARLRPFFSLNTERTVVAC